MSAPRATALSGRTGDPLAGAGPSLAAFLPVVNPVLTVSCGEESESPEVDPPVHGLGKPVRRPLCTEMAGQRRPRLTAARASLPGLFLSRARQPLFSLLGHSAEKGLAAVQCPRSGSRHASNFPERALWGSWSPSLSRRGPGALRACGTFQNLPWYLNLSHPSSATPCCPPPSQLLVLPLGAAPGPGASGRWLWLSPGSLGT